MFFLLSLKGICDLIDDRDRVDGKIFFVRGTMGIKRTVGGRFKHISMMFHPGSNSGVGLSNILFTAIPTFQQVNGRSGVTGKDLVDLIIVFCLKTVIMRFVS